jgi:hypothetical protein
MQLRENLSQKFDGESPALYQAQYAFISDYLMA